MFVECQKGIHFSMCFPKRAVPSLGEKGVVADHNTSHHGVGPCGEPTALGKFERATHPARIAGGRVHASALVQA